MHASNICHHFVLEATFYVKRMSRPTDRQGVYSCWDRVLVDSRLSSSIEGRTNVILAIVIIGGLLLLYVGHVRRRSYRPPGRRC